MGWHDRTTIQFAPRAVCLAATLTFSLATSVGCGNDTVDRVDAYGCRAGDELRPWFPDRDGDGFGDASAADAPEVSCAELDGFVPRDATDCDDSNAAINPAALEHCDGIDGDCDGFVDYDSSSGADCRQ